MTTLLPYLLVGSFLVNETPTADLGLVPADAQAFVSVRVAELWQEGSLKAMLPAEAKKAIADKEAAFGLSFADCVRLTYVMGKDANEKNPQFWLIVRTSRPIDEKKVLAQLIDKPVEKKQGQRKYYAAGDKSNDAFYVYSKQLFVVGTESGMRACFEQLDKPVTEGKLKAALQEAAGKHAIVAAGMPSADVTKAMLKDLPAEAKPFAVLLDAKIATLTVDVGAKPLTKAVLSFKDRDTAVKGAEAVIKLQKLAVDLMAAQIKNLPANTPAQLKTAWKNLDAAVRDAKVEQQDNAVVLSTKSGLTGVTALAAVGVYSFLEMIEQAKSQMAKLKAEQISQSLEVHKLKNADYPATLDALTKKQPDGSAPLIPAEALRDPWGQTYKYDPAGPQNKGKRADVFTKDPKTGKLIGNW